MYLDPAQVTGHAFNLARTDVRHFAGQLGTAARTDTGSFAQMLMDSLGQVNTDQQTAEQLAIAAMVNPDSVNAHDITIAEAKATMSLSIAKSVVDKVVQAYREISSVR